MSVDNLIAEWVDDLPTDSISDRLRLLRIVEGTPGNPLSQRDAAERAGLTFGEWQGLEYRPNPTGLDWKIKAIAKAFPRWNRDWLMWGGPSGHSEPTTLGPSADSGSPTQAKVAPLAEAA